MIDNYPNEAQTKHSARNFTAREPITDRFLETLRNNKPDWKNDRAFAKIIKKMEEGKNLKKEEFAKIHWFLWKIGH